MVFKNWLIVAVIAVSAQQSKAEGVTTMFFQNKYYSANRVFINPYNYSGPASDTTTFAVNNVISPTTEKFVISNLYSGLPYTGLDVPAGYQSISTTGGSPQVGNSLVQAYGTNSGLYMNLAKVTQYPFDLPNSSMQMVYNFKTPPRIWAVASDTMFCASGKMDLHTSGLGSNPNLSNQLNIAFIFRDNSSGNEFWYSFALYESRASIIPDDFIMKDNPKDTGLPIVIGFAKKQGGIGRFARDIPNYGNPLRAYYSGPNIPGFVDVGGCIQRDQFSTIISQLKLKYASYSNLSTNLNDYSVKHFNIDIEIAHNYSKDRSMGLTVNQFWIYNTNYAIRSAPQYGFFYSGNQNTLYACNVSSSRINMGGWIDVGNGCFHQYVPQLVNTGNATSCTDRRSFCNSNNKIEEVGCDCPALNAPWKLNQERDASGNVYRTCYRYETALSCIY